MFPKQQSDYLDTLFFLDELVDLYPPTEGAQ